MNSTMKEEEIYNFLLNKEVKELYDHYTLYEELYNNEDNDDKKCEYLVALNNSTSMNVIKKDNIYYVRIDEEEITEDDIKEKNFEYREPFVKISKLCKYILKNNLEYSYFDLETKNTIFHLIILNKNNKIIDKLLKQEKFDFKILNINNDTPLTLIKDVKIALMFINHLLEKQNTTKNELSLSKSHINDMIYGNYLAFFILSMMFFSIIVMLIFYK